MLTLALNLLVGPRSSCWHPNFASSRLHDTGEVSHIHLWFVSFHWSATHQRRLGAIHHNNMMASDTLRVSRQSHETIIPWIEQDSLSTSSWRRSSHSGVGVGWETLDVLNTWGQAMITLFFCRILFLLFLFSDYWYLYNVSFMLEIIVVNGIALHYYVHTHTHMFFFFFFFFFY